MPEQEIHKDTVSARQGGRRLDNFWVLIISTLVLIAIFGMLFLAYAMTATPPGTS